MQVPVYGPYPVLDSRRFHNPTSPLSVSDSQSLHPLSRGFAAQKMYYVVWNMREAHVPHNVIHQASAAGASKQSCWQSDRLKGRACHHPARGRARVLPVPDHSRPVHPDIADARRELVRVFERGLVADSLGIEDHHIGITTGMEDATVT